MEALASRGLVAFACVNSAAFVAHAPGGAAPVYGTNPLAFGCPRGGGFPPLVFDQATAAMARGEIQLLARDNERAEAHQPGKARAQLPPGVALDSAGRPTTDPGEMTSTARCGHCGDFGNCVFVRPALTRRMTGAWCFRPSPPAAILGPRSRRSVGGR